MRRRVCKSLAVVLMLSSALAGHTFASGILDILGLRLGMIESQVDAILQRQGIPASRITRNVNPCRGHPGCDVTITALTKDGELTISLTSDEHDPAADLMVARINYTLHGTAMGEREMIRSSVLDRFGRPSQAEPMTWCRSLTTDGRCRTDGPSLSFLPGSLTLILKAGSRDNVAE